MCFLYFYDENLYKNVVSEKGAGGGVLLPGPAPATMHRE